ncbi:lytic transglycosylase domain-containing protein [Blattabacterium cuenoti]|uniref:lytic transglycosylase domain-containing protein n=1 Tax=Blattabacterium cuenoti TaxID=1653831 RepID=UPI001EEBD9BE|nr:lytic transglycosylase domain-containing protein [Blattabacterium cuenoti]
MFFVLILKSLILQSASKPFVEQRRVILFYYKKTPIKNIDLIYIDNIFEKIFGYEKKYFSSRKKLRKQIHRQKKHRNNNIIITTINVDELKSRINYLNQKSQIKILKYNTIVHASVESYLRMGKHIEKIISLSDHYFPIFEEKLEKYHLPKELKYVAIIESNLNSTITSQAGAQGIWQIMPETGKKYNLKINHLYDERNDPVKSTEVACRYFKYLYKKIGNWELVLAAYNAGPGKIDKILIRHRKEKKDFWNLWEALPKETKNYIPKFIAINYVMNYYKEHNIYSPLETPYHFHKKRKFIPIKKEKMFLKLFSSTLNISVFSSKNLKLINPQYFGDLLPPEKYFFRSPGKVIFFQKKRKKIIN